jgi:hypothetical protein
MVLHPIALENGDRSVIAVNGAGYRDRTFRIKDSIALVFRNIKIIRNIRELLLAHLKNRTGIDRHSFSPMVGFLLFRPAGCLQHCLGATSKAYEEFVRISIADFLLFPHKVR